MGGSVALPLVVEVAFGAEPLDTGTLTWTDISDYVRRGTGIDFSRGWDTESDEPIAGRLTFTLNNETGDFTPGETGSFGEIRNRLPVRVSAVIGTATGNALTYDEGVGWYDMLGATYDDTEIGVVVLWTGLVESWRQSWENGVRSQVAVTCVDRWAAIRRLRIAGDPYWKVVGAQTPAAYWPLRDSAAPARPSTASTPDLLPWQYSTDFSSTSPTWNTTTPPPWVTDSAARTVYLTGGGTVAALGTKSASLGTTTEISISGWFQLAAVSPSVSAPIVIVGSAPYDNPGPFPRPNSISLDYDTNSSQMFTVASTYVYDNAMSGINQVACSGATYTERAGTWVHMAVTLKITAGSGVVKTYINGAPNGTVTRATGATFAVSPNIYLVGVGGAGTSIFGLGVWNRELTATEIAAQASGFMSWTGDKADVRAGRMVALSESASPLTLTTSGTFTATMSAQDLVDKGLADALMECANAEDGTLYMSTAGWPVIASRSWRVGNAVAFTIPATALAADLTFTLDDQQLTNSATVDRMVRDETAGTVKATADASITLYGEQNKSLQVWLDTDAQHLERANAEANQWSRPLVRSSDLTVDILTKNATIPAATMLGADIGQRIAVSGMPSEAPGATQFFIESISDRVTTTGWERTFTVSPRLDYFTIENSTFGVIDADNVLAF